MKIPIINSEIEQLLDVGLDGCPDNKETGKLEEYYGNKFTYGNIIYLTLEKMIKQKISFYNSNYFTTLT